MSFKRIEEARLNTTPIFPAHWAVRLKIDSLPGQADGSALSWLFTSVHEPATFRASLHLMHHDAFTRAVKQPAFPVFFGDFAVNASFTAFADASGRYCNPVS